MRISVMSEIITGTNTLNYLKVMWATVNLHELSLIIILNYSEKGGTL
jgi:hypothetical protein